MKQKQKIDGKTITFRPEDVLNEILRLKTDNQRYKEKIAALEHTLEKVVSNNCAELIVQKGLLGATLLKKKDLPNYVSSLTGTHNPGLDQDIKLMKLLERNVNDSKDELTRLNMYIK